MQSQCPLQDGPLSITGNYFGNHYGGGEHSPSKRAKSFDLQDMYGLNPIAQQLQRDREIQQEEERLAYLQQLQNEQAHFQLEQLQQQVDRERERIQRRNTERYSPRSQTYYSKQNNNPPAEFSYETVSVNLLSPAPETNFSKSRAWSAPPVRQAGPSGARNRFLRGEVHRWEIWVLSLIL